MRRIATPITKSRLTPGGNTLYYKRDDLLPFSFGGNKYRMAKCYMRDAGDADCIIVYGGARSNLIRCVANLCAAEGRACHVVMALEEDTRPANARLAEKLGATVHPCQKSQVAATLRRVMDECTAAGQKPYYTGGDEYGRGREGVPVAAYAEVYPEILAQEKELGLRFDRIFLPCGTGATQAGLLCGGLLAGDARGVVGISIARAAEVARAEVEKRMEAWLAGRKAVPVGAATVVDDYLQGGYGCTSPDIEDAIARVLAADGVPLDATYTGKAWRGMERYLTDKAIAGENVLFLHTGGTPLFFDDLKND